jgi:hypothetical protein
MAFYQAEGEGIDVNGGEPIPWDIQNKAIYNTSRAYLDWIPRNIERTGPVISRFVLDLSDVFRHKLLQHGSEPEAGRLSVKDPEALDSDDCDELRQILDDAVRWSVLHRCGQAGSYFPKHKTDVRPSEFYLNRILCPILRISPRPRWTTTLRTKELSRLLVVETRAKTRSSLLKRLPAPAPGKLFHPDGDSNE